MQYVINADIINLIDYTKCVLIKKTFVCEVFNLSAINHKKDSILKSGFFLKLFVVPPLCFFALSFLNMFLPVESGEEPTTWLDFIVGNLAILIIWFCFSFVISLIINELKKRKTKTKIIKKYITKSEDENLEKNKKIVEIKNIKLVKSLMITLFIITICSLWGGLWTMALVNNINPQNGFNFTRNAWVFWCWLPVSISSIILGFVYKSKGLKCTKNIVAGFIMSFFLLLYGAFCFFPTFSQKYSEINNYKEYIDANLPSNGDLEIQTWGKYFDNDKTDYSIINVYYNKEDVSQLEYSIKNSNNWILSTNIKSELKILLPSRFTVKSDIYYSIYNKTTGEYNTIPSESGLYEIYAMYYDKLSKELSIHNFKYVFVK